jgi:hypothetical protein
MQLLQLLTVCALAALIFGICFVVLPWLVEQTIARLPKPAGRIPHHGQRGVVTLLRSYNGLAAGAVAEFPAELEAALVAQKLATSGGTPTAGAQTRTEPPIAGMQGWAFSAFIAAGASSVVVSNANITANSKAVAVVAQAAADATLTQVLRCTCAAGTVTVTGNANATAATEVAVIVFN